MSELQFQLCITGILLAQKFGVLDRDFLASAKPILVGYNGGERPKIIIEFIDTMLSANDNEFDVMAAQLRAPDGAGLGLKNHATILIDSNAGRISQLPIELQSIIYEFKTSLNIYNQDVSAAIIGFDRTFDSTLSSENYLRLNRSLDKRYSDLQGVCVRVIGKIQRVLDYEL